MSPLLYSIYKHVCVTKQSSNTIIKFTVDTVVMGQILNDDEETYLKEVAGLSQWGQANHLSLNVNKTKDLTVEYARKQRSYTSLQIMH